MELFLLFLAFVFTIFLPLCLELKEALEFIFEPNVLLHLTSLLQVSFSMNGFFIALLVGG